MFTSFVCVVCHPTLFSPLAAFSWTFFLGLYGPLYEASRIQERLWSPQSLYGTDRKSTRLNSSHGYISYAVFCLKKKKTRIATGFDDYLTKHINPREIVARVNAIICRSHGSGGTHPLKVSTLLLDPTRHEISVP